MFSKQTITDLATAALLAGLASACMPEDEHDHFAVGPGVGVPAVVETAPVEAGDDAADDPAIWVNPADASASLVLGTNKKGGLYSYRLDGSVHQFLPLGRLNNVDLRPNVVVGDATITLVAATNRTDKSITLLSLDPATGMMAAAADGLQATGFADPYGLCLYTSRISGKSYVIANDKDGTYKQWEVTASTASKVKLRQVRTFAVGSTAEGCVADDETGMLYINEEDVALYAYKAEPDAGNERSVIAAVADMPVLKDDLEGVALYDAGNGEGYIVASSQGNNSYALFDRKAPHAYVGSFHVTASADGTVDGTSETDGLEVTSTALGDAFPEGLFVAQDGLNTDPDARQNFKLVSWAEIAQALANAKQ